MKYYSHDAVIWCIVNNKMREKALKLREAGEGGNNFLHGITNELGLEHHWHHWRLLLSVHL